MEQDNVKRNVILQFIAVLFLRKFDQGSFGDMLLDYQKSYNNKDNQYHVSIPDMIDVMQQ